MTNYLEFAKTLAREAGEVMRTHFLQSETDWKEDQTPLTIADTSINRMVIERVAQKFPGHSVLGEEESSKKDSPYAWVCDPVDGTLPYSHGLPIATFSLALCENGVSIVGVVYDPFMDRLFYASSGDGAYCNDRRLKVSSGGLDRAVIDIEGLGGPAPTPVVSLTNSFRDDLIERGVKPVQLWSSILPSVLVASGQFTAVIMNGSTIQDGAAVKVIVEEAGGTVTDMYGNDQRYDELARGFIASNGAVHDELVALIRDKSNLEQGGEL